MDFQVEKGVWKSKDEVDECIKDYSSRMKAVVKQMRYMGKIFS